MRHWVIVGAVVLIGCGGATSAGGAARCGPGSTLRCDDGRPSADAAEPAPTPVAPAPVAPAPVAGVPADADGLVSAEIPSPCGDGARLVLSAGTASYASTLGLDAPGGLELRPIATTDLDGDGTPELIAYVVCMPGGSGTFDSVRAYHVESGRVVEVAAIDGGDRADGGLDGARVVNHDLIVGRYSGDDEGLCCPTHVTEETWQLRAGHFTRTQVGARHAVDR